MDVLQGVVSRISRTAHVSGNQHGVSTSHGMTCEINRQAIEIWMPNPPNINDGDEVIVAGKQTRGTLHASAFRNLGNGANDRWNYNPGAFLCIIFMLMMFGVFAAILPVIGAPIIVYGIIGLVRGLREKFLTYQAYNAVLAADSFELREITLSRA